MHDWINSADPTYWRGLGRDLLGYIAGALVLATFSMKSMRPLRLTAVSSNIAFICYGIIANLQPILVLHAILLPLNLFRLVQTTSIPSFLSVAPRSAVAITLMMILVTAAVATAFATGIHGAQAIVPMTDWPEGAI